MTCQDNELLLNRVLIDLARSFLQYVAESWPWVSTDAGSIEQQVLVIAARQRQDVSDIAQLLTEREHFVDFGSYPTEYTDLQFLSLQSALPRVLTSQQHIARRLADAASSLRAAGDLPGADLLTAVAAHQHDATHSLTELLSQLAKTSPAIL